LKKLFIGSLPWAVDDAKLAEIFGQAGTVVSAQVIKDRETGRSRGFGFVEMSTEEEANAAVKNLNGADIDGRKIVVNIARPRDN
jgi:cold-inducible RNA-binding protein